ncbi:hypothetical protein BDP81DRAFT_451353 [Colletotrichum phormii]|uniref:Uncharacterized protein n=1 Tax=Colletotrichum phormii TaxID=359342 RepID=A0AAI9ZKR7_9PEZI|nr:uncharacterized protein BDP81DRAFT_451773 [Colletotrichum phormii]XP_060443466.1 uncharacterized protein BDP81DRAFT_451353 [Colletotrichum phormii]KAK1633793.1 hypothetical protein BDP81DRAFT_451773 [Colletotrichum phormii]KAK1634859.1 hypothetical protein BDP81DRAFT_451353 [Colletotrichum phormii]
MPGSNNDVIDKPLVVVSPPRPAFPPAHPGPVPELPLPGQEDVAAAGGDAENSKEFEALVGGEDVGDDEGEGGSGGSGDELSDPPPSASESEEESEEEEDDDDEDDVLSEKDSKKRKVSARSAKKKGAKKQKRTPRGQGKPRVPKKLLGEAPEERDVQCLPCLRAALRFNNRDDGGRCLVGSRGRCARCFNGRSAEHCVDVPVVMRPMAWALTEAIVGGASALEISKIRNAVNWIMAHQGEYEDHIRFWADKFPPPASPPAPPPSAPVLSVAPVVVVYDQAPVAPPAPTPQVVDLTVVPPPAPPAAPAARGFEDFEARKARFLARVSSLLAADAMVPAVSFFLDQEFK